MVRIERVGSCAVWTIDRPDTKNALDRATMEALVIAASDTGADATVRAVVLTGAGDSFVSGGDLRELRGKNTADDAEALADIGTRVCAALEAMSVPVIAALAGPAFGGGAELAMGCDLRIAEPAARISFKHVRMGVTTGWGTTARLVSLVGAGAAARLLYTAEEVSGASAFELRLVDALSPPGGAVAAALEWGEQIARGAPRALAQTKRLLLAARANADVSARERRAFVETWAAPEHAEAMDAYFERRRPTWPR